MANLKDIKRRIGSVKNTQQITKAMKLVAAAKLRKAQEAVTAARPYSEKMALVMESLAKRSGDATHPLLQKRDKKNVLIVMMSGDKGLCGPFNTNIIKTSQKLIAENEGCDISIISVGKKGVDFFSKRPHPIVEKYLDYGKNISADYAKNMARTITKYFTDEKVDQVYLVYNKFKNVVVQEPQSIPLLPVALEGGNNDPDLVDYEYEPSANEVLGGILTLYVENRIYQGLLESAASENGARMTAMDAATKNAKEMIEELTLQYNSARQAAITTELIEVVTGADALAG